MIAYLADHPALIPVLARWQHDEWSHLNPDRTLADRIAELALHGRGGVPTTLVELSHDGLPLGSASLIEQDMHTHTELRPWLASVYVAPPHRGRGIASALVEGIHAEARAAGIERLYLFTPDQERLYARLGWCVRSRERFAGEDVVVMEIDLA